MGGDKLLRTFGDGPLIAYSITNALAVCSRVIVVLGHAASELRSGILGFWPSSDRIVLVENHEYRRGMITSIARGALEVEGAWFFVAPADMPFLSPDLFREIGAAAPPGADSAVTGNADAGARAAEGRADRPTRRVMAIMPIFQGTPAHPTLINSGIRPALSEFLGSTPGDLPSMRRYLQDMETMKIPVAHDGAVIDIDTPEAFERHSARARRSGIGT